MQGTAFGGEHQSSLRMAACKVNTACSHLLQVKSLLMVVWQVCGEGRIRIQVYLTPKSIKGWGWEASRDWRGGRI